MPHRSHWHHAWARKLGRLPSTCCCTMSYQVIQRYHPLVSGITTISPGSTRHPQVIQQYHQVLQQHHQVIQQYHQVLQQYHQVLQQYHQVFLQYPQVLPQLLYWNCAIRVLQQCLQHWQRWTPSVTSHYPSPLVNLISQTGFNTHRHKLRTETRNTQYNITNANLYTTLIIVHLLFHIIRRSRSGPLTSHGHD